MNALGLAEWFRRRALRAPDCPALTFDDTTWSFAEMQDRIERFADMLAAGGTTAGERVGYLGFNHSEFLVAMFATARLGAIFVPLNFRLTSAELAFMIGDSGVRTLIADAPHQAVIDTTRSALGC